MPSRDEATAAAAGLMAEFVERTGLAGTGVQRRYLWTDAFAVCNLLGLARQTGERRWAELALRLVDQVHHVLGRHRHDDPRTGWLSGLDDEEAERHPTRGGLRIGKPLRERAVGEPSDQELEWDRDGQYFHYLTKWMHALDQVARSTREPRYNVWARELAETASRAFVQDGPGARRMVWKMSTDLSRPLVASMGQHDPLDGFVTYIQLEATATLLGSSEGPRLGEPIADLAAILEQIELATADPLGLGGLLSDAFRSAQLALEGVRAISGLVDLLLASAGEGLEDTSRAPDFRQPASHRLAFRELGLAIGLFALDRLRADEERLRALGEAALPDEIRALAPHAPLGPAIVSFWLDPAHRRSRAWSEHRDINEVMLATSLLPDGLLVLGSPVGFPAPLRG